MVILTVGVEVAAAISDTKMRQLKAADTNLAAKVGMPYKINRSTLKPLAAAKCLMQALSLSQCPRLILSQYYTKGSLLYFLRLACRFHLNLVPHRPALVHNHANNPT